MMGFGFLSMILVVALPIAGIIVLVVWLVNANKLGNPFSVNPPPEKREQTEGQGAKRFCSHCGGSLEDSWIHCSQCGAEVVA